MAIPASRPRSGTTYASFSIAINQRAGRDRRPYADWFRIVAFDKLAETLAKIGKGDEVLVTGSLHRTSYQTKDGVLHNDVEVRARAIEFLRRSQRNAAEPLPEESPTDEQPADAPLAPDAGVEAPTEIDGAEAPPDLDGAEAPSGDWPPADLAEAGDAVQPPTEARSRRRRALG